MRIRAQTLSSPLPRTGMAVGFRQFAGACFLAMLAVSCRLEAGGLARMHDAGVGFDAGAQDSGTDAGLLDGGLPDAGFVDAGGPLRLAFEAATFTRATVASQFDESVGLLAWFGPNEGRYRTRAGQRELLFEGSTTNLLVGSEGGWSAAGPTGISDDVSAAPDLTMSADEVAFGSSAGIGTGGAMFEAVAAGGAPGYWVQSAFVRLVAGGPLLRHRISDGVTTRYASAFAAGVTWSRVDFAPPSPGNLAYWSVGTFRDFAADPDLPAITVEIWGAMVEARPFPSTYVRSSGVPGTRDADVLTFGSLPAWLRVGGAWQVSVTPEWASAELMAPAYLFDRAGMDYARLVPSAGMTRIEVATGGVVVVSHDFGVSRGSTVTFTLDPAAGTVAVAGAASGDGTTTGTPWAWEDGSFVAGTDLFAWLGEPHTP